MNYFNEPTVIKFKVSFNDGEEKKFCENNFMPIPTIIGSTALTHVKNTVIDDLSMNVFVVMATKEHYNFNDDVNEFIYRFTGQNVLWKNYSFDEFFYDEDFIHAAFMTVSFLSYRHGFEDVVNKDDKDDALYSRRIRILQNYPEKYGEMFPSPKFG